MVAGVEVTGVIDDEVDEEGAEESEERRLADKAIVQQLQNHAKTQIRSREAKVLPPPTLL